MRNSCPRPGPSRGTCRAPHAREGRAVAELLEVPGEEARRVAVALARLVREPLGLERGEPHRGDERLLEARGGRPTTGSGAAQTAKTIGRPVRSSQSFPRSWCGSGPERALQRGIPDQELRVGVRRLDERDEARRAGEAPSSGRPRSRSRASPRPSPPGRGGRATRAGSSPPHPPTRRTGGASAAGGSHCRAYSIDEIVATSTSPARSSRLSSAGMPTTSSTSWVRRWKTGAMLTYEMRPRRIIAG